MGITQFPLPGRLAHRLARLLCSQPASRQLVLDMLAQDHPQLLTQALLQHPALPQLLREAPAPLRQRGFTACCEALQGESLSEDVLQAFIAASDITCNYSQEGEELALQRLMPLDSSGHYVEVGAYHPRRLSNTYALYRRGWRGLNIDATPGSMEAFRRLRPEDVNVEHAVSDSSTPLQFHEFASPALNTFDAALAETYVAAGWERSGIREITPRPLRDILAEHWPQGRPIHLMNIDVEGEEMGVLRSNDWDAYRPQWLIIEVLDTPLQALEGHPVIAFLAARGYVPVAKLAQSVILTRGT